MKEQSSFEHRSLRNGFSGPVYDYVAGAPELIVEITSHSASFDLGRKMEVYRRSGVREYLVRLVLESSIDWFVFQDGRYLALKPDPSAIYRSSLMPGLWLDVAALLQGDFQRVHSALKLGVDSSELLSS